MTICLLTLSLILQVVLVLEFVLVIAVATTVRPGHHADRLLCKLGEGAGALVSSLVSHWIYSTTTTYYHYHYCYYCCSDHFLSRVVLQM